MSGEKNNGPAFGNTCSIFKSKNRTRTSEDTKNVEELKDMQVVRGGAEIFTLNTPTKIGEKVKINGKYFHIRVDTGSDTILIPVNFLPDLGKLLL